MVDDKSELKEEPKEAGDKVHKMSPDETAFKMMRTKIDKLLDDYIDFYFPKTKRAIEVSIKVKKEGGTEWFTEAFEYSPNVILKHSIQIK